MIADLFSVPQTTFFTIRKQQTLNFSYHESSRWQFSLENQWGLKTFRTDKLPKRSVGCPCLFLNEPFTLAEQLTPACRKRNVARFRYSILVRITVQFSPTWRPFFVQEILNLIQRFVAAVLTLFDASSFFLLSQALLAEQSCSRLIFCYFLWPSGRKWRSSSARYRADNVEVNHFFLNSPGFCKRSQSISDRNSSLDFL